MSKLHNIFHRSHKSRPHPDVASRVRMWTWKNPANGVQFTYSNAPAKNRNRDSRGPIPFGSPSLLDTAELSHFSRAFIEEKHVSPIEDIAMTGPHVKDIADGPREIRHSSQLDMFKHRRHGLVISHEIRQPWDDAPRLDIPYENPAFTTPVDNVLWLPTNPCAILDLDETVLMFRAITSEPGAGALGQWVNDTNSMYVEAPHTRRHLEDGQIPEETDAEWAAGNDQHLTGMEKIELSPGIESRVDSLGKGRESDDDGDRTSFFGKRRPTYRRQSSSKSTRSNGPGGRSFSGGTVTSQGRTLRPMASQASANQWLSPGPSTTPVQISPRTHRVMSVGSARSRMRAQSNATTQYSHSPVDSLHPLDPGAAYVDHNQNHILNNRPVVESPNEGAVFPVDLGGQASLGLGQPSRRRSSVVSQGGRSQVSVNNRGSVAARDALVGEVLAEEQEASQKVRKEEEEEMAAEAEGKKPWYSAWLYHNSNQEE